MSLDWQSVPQRFHYLQNIVLDKRVNELGVARYDSNLGRHVNLAEKLSPEELNDLARVFREICRREDNLAILDWIGEVRKERPAGRDTARDIRLLLVVLQELGQLGVAPYSEKPILAERPPAPFDWSNLPPELEYLGEAVERYSDFRSESGICDWLNQASEADIGELNSLAQRMIRDTDSISNWSKEHRRTREESCVFWLWMAFRQAGIEID